MGRGIDDSPVPPAGMAPMANLTARDAQRHATLQAHLRAHSQRSIASSTREIGRAHV